jgi:hypothetical protein
MSLFLVRRLCLAALVCLTVLVVSFILTRLSGDLAASIAGPNATAADIAIITKNTRHRGRATSRYSRRMEPAIRGARSQSAIAAAPAQDPELGQRKTRNTAQLRSNFVLKVRPPGTEFLGAKTGRLKSPLRRANAHRDQNLRNNWPKIPAEPPYLASYRKHAVCGDWMVGAPGLEPGTR